MIFFIIYAGLFVQQAVNFEIPKSCPDLKFNEIPCDHLFHKKQKPLVIAHRGLPRKYQENTYDSIVKSLDTNADGFELDIYKTKDDKLVAFHDDNAKRMTGVDMVIYNSTYEELQKLNITDTITAGGKTYKFDKTRKIPLLEDILKVTSKKDMIHYLEMKPSIPYRPHELQLAKDTARLVGKMISKLKVERKAIIVSFDFRKIKYLKQYYPNITVGTLFTQKFAVRPKQEYLEMQELGNLKQCVHDAPNDTLEFFKFVLNSGLFFKQSGSSSFDCDIKLYNNPAYSNNTLPTLRDKWGANISTGFYTIYSMGKTEVQNKADEGKVSGLIADGGGHRLITDDVERATKFLGKSSPATVHQSNLLLLFYLALFCNFLLTVDEL